jgi:hypothetical protein
MRGLPGVDVIVEGFSSPQESAGFDDRAIQTDVELKLRMAGIKVLETEERVRTVGQPYLYVNVNALHRQPGIRDSFAITFQLIQGVTLKRLPDLPFAEASTWSNGMVGQGGLPFVRESVREQADIFVNAWLSVNPKD